MPERRPKTYGRLFFEDYSVADPDDVALHDAMWTARYALAKLTQAQAYLLLGAVESWCHVAAHPAPNRMILAQLREVRRAVLAYRKRPAAEKGSSK